MALRDMTTEEQISKNEDERDEARQNLRDTLTEVNAKVERAGDDLRPDHFIESHAVAASLVAGALGFLIFHCLFLISNLSTNAKAPIPRLRRCVSHANQ